MMKILPRVPCCIFRTSNKLGVDKDRVRRFVDLHNPFHEATAHARYNDVTSVKFTKGDSRTPAQYKVVGVSPVLLQFICVAQALVHGRSLKRNEKNNI